MTDHSERTTVTTATGELNAGIWIPDRPGPLPGLVLVDGSGDGAFDDWGEWPSRLADCGAVVLTHDKPGCGGSPGNWTEQTFTDRANESLAAWQVLRDHPAVAGRPVGFFGVSQGGWVSLLAASMRLRPVDFVISMSGPGVTPAEQELYRVGGDLAAEGFTGTDLTEALAWIDERNTRLISGEPADQVLAAQLRYADRPWYESATRFFDNPAVLAFIARILDFDPAKVLPKVPCPVLGVFGAADPLVPVAASVAAFAKHLPQLPAAPHGLAVFPGADHGLFTADPDPAVSRTDQLAPGFLAMVAEFIAQDHRPRRHTLRPWLAEDLVS